VSDVPLFARGRLGELSAVTLGRLLDRKPADDADVGAAVAGMLTDVRARGDAALREMAQRYDGVRLDALEVPRRAWEGAAAGLDPAVRAGLERAAANIRRFHEAQLPVDVTLEVEPGVRITRTWTPLARVGVYAPGGRAAYPSSVLMGVVPARAAGVGEVIVCSPPGAGGTPPREVLAACAIGGADRLFALGGAGAVAAMAFGSESVPRVDAVVGPGNRWVTEAKRQVAGNVMIDSPAGPSEVLVLADAAADPELVALELMAQAEHDPDAACVLVTTSETLAAASESALAAQLATAPRADICRRALATSGAMLVAASMDEAIDFVDRYAPEHLSVMTADALADARRVRTAGTTFVGPSASVAFGDYMTGANHVLPTAGRARSFSGLSTMSYLRSFTIQEVTPPGAAAMSAAVVALARAEGLPAHAAAAAARGAP
jgi:histidinol dehydrogenase